MLLMYALMCRRLRRNLQRLRNVHLALGTLTIGFKAQNANISQQFHNAPNSFGKTVMDAAKNSILGERKFRLMNQRDMEKLSEDYHTEKYLRHQQVHRNA